MQEFEDEQPAPTTAEPALLATPTTQPNSYHDGLITDSPEKDGPATPETVSQGKSFSYIEDNKPLGKLKNELTIVKKAISEKQFLLGEIEIINKKLQESIKINNKLKKSLEQKEFEIESMKNDMEVLGEKLLAEIQTRELLEEERNQQGGELEDLTQTLFEQANNMVAQEAKERHGAQELVRQLEKQLQAAQLTAQMEHKQCVSLRQRIATLEDDLDHYKKYSSIDKSEVKPLPELNQSKKESLPHVDKMLVSHFEQLLQEAPTARTTRIHQLLFMKNSLEDDVIPCLSNIFIKMIGFGGDPHTSTKKFIDSIIANNCFIEEMTDEQIKQLLERDEEIMSKSSSEISPTRSLFNKTVLEKISNAWQQKPIEKHGCSTCGRSEPYKYRFKVSDVEQDTWYPICKYCRSRLLAVIDYYQFIRNIRQNLYRDQSLDELYFEVLNLKQRMFYTRLGIDEMDYSKLSGSTLDQIKGDANIVPTPIQRERQ
jgi:DNA-directed RNA polymerase subunit RPC12/RpoP/ribosome-binding protein aMBF1 (putative translation factor)